MGLYLPIVLMNFGQVDFRIPPTEYIGPLESGSDGVLLCLSIPLKAPSKADYKDIPLGFLSSRVVSSCHVEIYIDFIVHRTRVLCYLTLCTLWMCLMIAKTFVTLQSK